MLQIGNDENMFVPYSYPRFDWKLNASLFLSTLSLICLFYIIQVCLYGPLVIWQSQYLNHGAILLKALGGGIRVLWTHISSLFFAWPSFQFTKISVFIWMFTFCNVTAALKHVIRYLSDYLVNFMYTSNVRVLSEWSKEHTISRQNYETTFINFMCNINHIHWISTLIEAVQKIKKISSVKVVLNEVLELCLKLGWNEE